MLPSLFRLQARSRHHSLHNHFGLRTGHSQYNAKSWIGQGVADRSSAVRARKSERPYTQALQILPYLCLLTVLSA